MSKMAPESTGRAREKADAAAALQTSLYSLYPMIVELELDVFDILPIITEEAAVTSQLVQEFVKQIEPSLNEKS